MFRKMRRIDMQMSDYDTIALLKRGQYGVLGTISDNGYPYNVVVNYVFYNNKIYFHCAKTGQKIDNINQNDKVCFSVFDNVEVIGEKLNTKYQSLTVFGRAKVLDATKELLSALIKKYSNLKVETADKMISKEIDLTAIVEIEIEDITGKSSK
jgi:uncharacterized protein